MIERLEDNYIVYFMLVWQRLPAAKGGAVVAKRGSGLKKKTWNDIVKKGGETSQAMKSIL